MSALLSIVLVSCEITDFGEEFQTDPNLLSPEEANPSFILNNIQIEFADFLMDIERTVDEVMRYKNLNNTYAEVSDQGVLNGEWINYYTFLQDAEVLNDLAANDENLRFHRGISRVITSYATVTMVDYFGDIPFSEANRADEGLNNPVPDDGEVVYNTLLSLLDEAKADLNAGTPAPENDLYYRGDRDKWVRLANSLQFKMLLNMDDTAGMNALIAEDNMLENMDDDFQFSYSTQIDPLSRHPNFVDGYIAGGQATYMGNSFMNLLLNGKSIRDPRIRYYIFRQSSLDPIASSIPCVNDPMFDFCYLGDSYHGRDHGDLRPASSDQQFRAIYGLYPVGGAFDEDNPVTDDDNIIFGVDAPNQEGAGILPILLSSFLDFLRAEAAISLGTIDEAEAFLESGIRKSMDKVLNFANGIAVNSDLAATPADVDAYVTEVLTAYQAADDQGKLDIILEEYYIASYGNSTESYNGYRRTGFPSSLQAPIENVGSPFPRTFAYPTDAINNNSSLSPRPITTQVFWDTNPPGFIQ
ncbi:MAG: SusD/RagB family nutrient-binding outer membrane lipoprotein [Bacteroidota bacterium]